MKFRLRSLTIHKFRDVRPETTLRFNDGWNVLLGQNATGKTTLLNLISMALRGNFLALAEESFSVSYELAGAGDDSMRVHLENEVTPRVGTPGMTVGEDVVGARTVGEIRFQHEGNESRIQIPNDRLASVRIANAGLSPSFVATFSQDVVGRTALLKYSSGECYRFDEALAAFRRLHGETDDAVGLPAPFSSDLIALVSPTVVVGGFMPRSVNFLLDYTDATPQLIRGHFDDCHYIQAAVVAMGARSVTATWIVEKVQGAGPKRTLTLRPPTFLFQREDGTAFSTNHLSFGQKRLFAFAWYLDANEGPVVADELVNGMHYAWIEDCVRAMEGRQVFLTAQNPLLLDHVGVASPEDASSRFILCRNEVAEDKQHVWAWTNPTREQSEAFFEAYQNGILQVHEILRTEGLW